jgi:hypothetical protein
MMMMMMKKTWMIPGFEKKMKLLMKTTWMISGE